MGSGEGAEHQAEEADADLGQPGAARCLIAIFLLGWYVYYVMTGSWGFGIGDEKQFLDACRSSC